MIWQKVLTFLAGCGYVIATPRLWRGSPSATKRFFAFLFAILLSLPTNVNDFLGGVGYLANSVKKSSDR